MVAGALAVEPRDRWQSAADFAAAARNVAATYAGARQWSPDRTQTTVDGSDVRPVVRSVPGFDKGGPDGASIRRRRRVQLLAAAATLLVLVVAAVWATVKGAVEPRDDTGPSTVPAGFVRCGTVFCPAAPMCWGGLNLIGGRSEPPTAVDCAEPHPWETYAAADLPVAALNIRQDELLASRPDVAAVCSTDRMGERSQNPASTAAFTREPWPVQVDGGVWIFHCLAGPGVGEVTGARFRSGA